MTVRGGSTVRFTDYNNMLRYNLTPIKLNQLIKKEKNASFVTFLVGRQNDINLF